ncbi:MAG: hypothetical protein Q9219_005599 [cf. Caloplaca sp. 3 TL-2023]
MTDVAKNQAFYAGSSLSTLLPEPTQPSNSSSDFNIVKTYNQLLHTDPLLTKPIAAIESLILLLSHSPPSTTSETLSLLAHHSSILKFAAKNSIALSAGTDLFQRYIVSILQSSPLNPQDASREESRVIRDHVLSSGRLFLERAKESRGMIAQQARELVRDNATVLTSGGSQTVAAVLNAAAEKGIRYRVIYVLDTNGDLSIEEDSIVRQLRSKGTPVAVIGPSAIAYCLGQTTLAMVGAEVVTENGGVVARMGTYQLAMLAQGGGKPFYVVVESHKFYGVISIGTV